MNSNGTTRSRLKFLANQVLKGPSPPGTTFSMMAMLWFQKFSINWGNNLVRQPWQKKGGKISRAGKCLELTL